MAAFHSHLVIGVELEQTWNLVEGGEWDEDDKMRGVNDKVSDKMRGVNDKVSYKIRGVNDKVSDKMRGVNDKVSDKMRGVNGMKRANAVKVVKT